MRSLSRIWRWALPGALLLAGLAQAFEMQITENDEQVCSGMYAGEHSHINVTFDGTSRGQLAMVIYEWGDVRYLGVPSQDEMLPRTYICTTDAIRQSLCTASSLGKFIVTLPDNKTLADTSIWTASVGFRSRDGEPAPPPVPDAAAKTDGSKKDPTKNKKRLLDDPIMRMRAGRNRRLADHSAETKGEGNTPTDGSVLWYDRPIHYEVKQTGYYCVGVIPVTILHKGESAATATSGSTHASFSGTVLFRNAFEGHLSAADYPKITFYLIMMLVYTALAAGWALLCYRHRYDLLAIQNYISALLGLVVIEMLANWAYYRYLNAQGNGIGSKVFLFVVSILDAGRNSLSFFLLLVVALGLGVVREEIPEMTKCRILGIAHATFGVLYAIGMDLVQLETVSALLLILFVVPLAFTMTAFLLWIMYALTGTIAELGARKQRYKLSLFTTLYRILLFAVVSIGVFFVWTTMSFSNRFAEDYAPSTWSKRWWLLDGFLVLLYMVVFSAIAFLWRPTGSNRRLAMSDELAQDEEDADDYDLEAMELRGERAKMEAMRGIDEMAGAHDPDREGGIALPNEDVVFEIGDDGASDDDEPRRPTTTPSPRAGDRRGIMHGKQRSD